jgi:hypothetical protein
MTACAVLVICICILMQMLGTTMTLWNPEFDLDPVNAVLLEGFSLPASCLGIPPPEVNDFFSDLTLQRRYALPGHTLFRPPNFRM